MRRLIAVLLTGAGFLVAGCGASGDGAASTARFPQKSVEVAQVTVTATPQRVDSSGAVVQLKLDTHTTPLDMDLPRSVTLTVGGTVWPAQGWDGPGSSGHHREGTLRFTAGGPATGEVRLQLNGLARPAVLIWPTTQG